MRDLYLRILGALTLGIVAIALTLIPGTHSTARSAQAQSVLDKAAKSACIGGNFSCNYCAPNPATDACQPSGASLAESGAPASANSAPIIGSAEAAAVVSNAWIRCPAGWVSIGQSQNLSMSLSGAGC